MKNINTYLKKEDGIDNKYFTALGDGISIDVHPHSISICENTLSLEGYKGLGYIECTREEFMEYYLPINKKMNELISEL